MARATRSGRGIGLGPVSVQEVEAKRGGGAGEEAGLLQKAVPKGARLIAMDERGKPLTSVEFSNTLATWRDQGVADVACLIGGADGLDLGLVGRADLTLSLGRMVWPHMLARVMLAEQIYRATQILTGTPYHRA